MRIFGVDINYNDRARERLLEYMRANLPERLPSTEQLFRTHAEEQDKFPHLDRGRLASTLPEITALRLVLTEQRDRLVAASSGEEFQQMLKYAELMEQWVLSHAARGAPSGEGVSES